MKFGVNVQIFGFGIFQEGPELLQSIELAYRKEEADAERRSERSWAGDELSIKRLRGAGGGMGLIHRQTRADPGREKGKKAWMTRPCSRAPTPALTSFVVLHCFLLKILEDVQPELLFQAITVVSKKALQTVSVEHKPVKLGHGFFTCKTGKCTSIINELRNRFKHMDYQENGN